MPPFPTARLLIVVVPTSCDVGYKYTVRSADSGIVLLSPLATEKGVAHREAFFVFDSARQLLNLLQVVRVCFRQEIDL